MITGSALVVTVILHVDFLALLCRVAETYPALHINQLVTGVVIAGTFAITWSIGQLARINQETDRRQRAERDAAWSAHYDFLTELPNRRYLERHFAATSPALWPPTRRVGVLTIDLDGFKRVNDLAGHTGGDALLKELANRIRRLCPTGTIVRLGGDEFAILMDLGNVDDAISVGQTIVSALSMPVEIEKIEVEVGASLGIAMIPDHAATLEQALHRSDIAMQTAKKSRRNSVHVYNSSMDLAVSERVQAEVSLRDAIRHDRIQVHYQPLVDLMSGKLLGFEALARWIPDDSPPVPPSIFIGVAEDIGLIIELTEQLLRRASLDALAWPKDARLAFNLSPTLLTDTLLGLRIVKILAETSFPPHRLEIEITESALMNQPETARTIIGDLKAAGIRIALDDFGTGYSSLSQLSRFAFDRVKIDRSFVEALDTDDKRLKIVKAIVDLSRGLGLSTTVEGIENEAQLGLVRAIGCDQGQGFLFGAAAPPNEISHYFSRRCLPLEKVA